MPVEFLGMIATQHASEIHPMEGPLVDPEYVTRFAQAHEESGFDRVLIGYSSVPADPRRHRGGGVGARRADRARDRRARRSR